MARLRSRTAAAPTVQGGFPLPLLDQRHPAWVDEHVERDQDDFGRWAGRRRRHGAALLAFAVQHGLMREALPASIDWHACRRLAESHGQRWPYRRITIDSVRED